MDELKSKCHGAEVRKARFSSLLEKKYCEPFYICNMCNKLTKVEEKKGGGMSKLNQEELLEKLEIWVKNHPFSDKDRFAYAQIVALIQKPEITEEWYEEKAKWLFEHSAFAGEGDTLRHLIPMDTAKDFIRKLVEEIHGRKEDKF